jgi:hypothetical protein
LQAFKLLSIAFFSMSMDSSFQPLVIMTNVLHFGCLVIDPTQSEILLLSHCVHHVYMCTHLLQCLWTCTHILVMRTKARNRCLSKSIMLLNPWMMWLTMVITIKLIVWGIDHHMFKRKTLYIGLVIWTL